MTRRRLINGILMSESAAFFRHSAPSNNQGPEPNQVDTIHHNPPPSNSQPPTYFIPLQFPLSSIFIRIVLSIATCASADPCGDRFDCRPLLVRVIRGESSSCDLSHAQTSPLLVAYSTSPSFTPHRSKLHYLFALRAMP